MKTPLFKNCCKMMSICMLFFFTNFTGYSLNDCVKPSSVNLNKTSCTSTEVCYSVTVVSAGSYTLQGKYMQGAADAGSFTVGSGSGTNTFTNECFSLTSSTYDNVTFWAYDGTDNECVNNGTGIGCCTDAATGPLVDACAGSSGNCPNISIEADGDQTNYCGTPFNLTVSGNEGYSVAWDGLGVQTIIPVNSPGIYKACIQDANTSCTNCTLITIGESCDGGETCSWSADVDVDPNSPTCLEENGSVELTASGGPSGGSYSYSWSTGQSSASINASSIGTYVVTITDTGVNCTSVASYTVGNCGAGANCVTSEVTNLTCVDNTNDLYCFDLRIVSTNNCCSGTWSYGGKSSSVNGGSVNICPSSTGDIQDVIAVSNCSDGTVLNVTNPCTGGGGGTPVCNGGLEIEIVDATCANDIWQITFEGTTDPPGACYTGQNFTIVQGTYQDGQEYTVEYDPEVQFANNFGFTLCDDACGANLVLNGYNECPNNPGPTCPYDVNITNVVCSETGYTFDLSVTTTDPEILAAGELASWSASGVESLVSGGFGTTQTVTVSDLDVTSFTLTQAVQTRLSVIECLGTITVDPSTDCGTGGSCADVVITTECAESNEDYIICMTVEDLTGNANYWFPTGDISGDGTVYNFGVEQCFAISGLGDTDFDIVLSEGMEPRTNTEIVVCTASQLVSAPVGCGGISNMCDFSTEIREVCTETGYDVCITVTDNSTLASAWYLDGDLGTGNPRDGAYEFKTEECFSIIGYNDISYNVILQTALQNQDGSLTCFEANTSSAPAGCGVVDPCEGFSAEITSSAAVVCLGPNQQPVILTANATAGVNPYSYEWSTTETTETISIVNGGIFKVTITDDNDCLAEFSFTIEESKTCTDPCETLTGVIIPSVSPVCDDKSVTATLSPNISGGTPPYTYMWSNGATTETIDVTSGGTYSLVVTDASDNCVLNMLYFLNEEVCTQPCSIAATSRSGSCENYGTPDESDDEYKAQINIASNATCYVIKDSNGVTVASGTLPDTPTVTIPADGITQETFTIENCEDSNCSTTITLGPVSPCSDGVCELSADAGPGIDLCNGQMGSLNASGMGGTEPYSYNWDNGLGSGASQIVSCTTDGRTVYTVTVSDANGCTATDIVEVVCVVGESSISTSFYELTCTRTSIVLTANPSTGYTYEWLLDGTSVGTGSTYNASGVGTYALVTTKDGKVPCKTTSEEIEITENTSSPEVTVSNDGPLTCTQGLVNITTTAAEGLQYAWEGPGGSTSNQPNFPVAMAGEYCVTVTDPSNGCTTETCTTVLEDSAMPSVDCGGPYELTCNTTSIEICPVISDESITGGVSDYSYQWIGPGGASGSEACFTATVAGTYTIIVTDNENGCSATCSAMVVNNTIAPNADLSADSNQVTCNNEDVRVTIGPFDLENYTYEWSGDCLSGNISDVEFIDVTSACSISVVVTDKNNGCTTTETITIFENTTGPIAIAYNLGPITCDDPIVQVCFEAEGDDGNQFSYEWFDCDLMSKAIANKRCFDVATAGDYCVLVTDLNNGCTATASTTVEGNTDCGKIGDYVWHDLNYNGLQDIGEPAMGGVTVQLKDASFNVLETTTTSGSGFYQFDELSADDYYVMVIPPSGYGYTLQDAGAEVLDSDIDPTTGNTALITLGAGQMINDIDVGIFKPAAIGDFVWEDANGNGLQDVGEQGIAGVTVSINYPDGSPVLDIFGNNINSMLTNSAGGYVFNNLPSGDFKLTIVIPTGYAISPSNVDGSAGTQAGDSDIDNDFDEDMAMSHVISVECGDEVFNVDAGLYQTLSLGNQVWSDANNNGQIDAGENGIEGVVMILLDGFGNPVLDAAGNPITTTTDVNGNYVFTGLAPGDYQVKVDPSNFAPGGPLDGLTNSTGNDPVSDPDDDADNDDNGFDMGGMIVSDIITLTSGGEPTDDGDTDPNTNMTVDFGFLGLAELGDYVWLDSNVNGFQDGTEAGINGVTVNLYEDVNGDGIPDGPAIGTTTTGVNPTTGADGYYQFGGLNPGDYIVEFIAPTGYFPSPQDSSPDGSDSDADETTGLSQTVTLMVGDSDQTIDAGYYEENKIGNLVWEELGTPDGLYDSSTESGIEGVIVELYELVGGVQVFVGSTTTDASGNYLFDNLPAGNYQVKFNTPSGFEFTTTNAGSDDTIDSDVNPGGFTVQTYSLTSGTCEETADAGLLVMLPIELLSFDAEYNGDEVAVTWETASEINNDYFEVERSTDGSDYEVIADVDGAGNSTTVQSYGINDADVEIGTYYYRLKQVDFDGSYSYSEVRSVVIEQTQSRADLTMSVYPNPARDFVTIDINAEGQEVEMRLYAADGKLMSNVHYDTAIDTDMTSIRLDASGLPRGVYVARVLVGQQSITKKLFIIE